jgi:hypothetical protein
MAARAMATTWMMVMVTRLAVDKDNKGKAEDGKGVDGNDTVRMRRG